MYIYILHDIYIVYRSEQIHVCMHDRVLISFLFRANRKSDILQYTICNCMLLLLASEY